MGQFLNCIYGSSRIVLLTIQELSKAQCNNTDNNYTDYSDTDLILSCPLLVSGHFYKCDYDTSRSVVLTSLEVWKWHGNNTDNNYTDYSNTDSFLSDLRNMMRLETTLIA